MKKGKNISDITFYFVVNSVLIIVLVVTVYPFIYILSNSISNPFDVLRGGVYLYPIGFDLQAYGVVLENERMLTSYLNTIKYTLSGTSINLLLTSLAAYPLSRTYFIGRKFFRLIVVIPLVFTGGIIPDYLLVKHLGFIDTIWAVIIPCAISSFNCIIMTNFFMSLPDSVMEASIIDGCNELQVLYRIVLPLSLPIMATLGLYYAVYHWNDFFRPLIYLNSAEREPLQLFLRKLIVQSDMAEEMGESVGGLLPPDTIKYASIIVSIIPVLCIYPFIQKYFVKGVLVGSVKG